MCTQNLSSQVHCTSSRGSRLDIVNMLQSTGQTGPEHQGPELQCLLRVKEDLS